MHENTDYRCSHPKHNSTSACVVQPTRILRTKENWEKMCIYGKWCKIQINLINSKCGTVYFIGHFVRIESSISGEHYRLHNTPFECHKKTIAH